MELLSYDANGTDGEDLSLMWAVYVHQGQKALIPADTPAGEVEDAVYHALGLDPAVERAREAKRLQLKDTDLTQIKEDIQAARSLEELRTALGALVTLVGLQVEIDSKTAKEAP